MDKKIAARAALAIEEKVFPGCVVGIVRASGERDVLPFGRLTYEEGSPEVREDTLYDVASITKSIPTASLALTLMQEGKLHLDDPIQTLIPGFQHDRGATVEDLLRYRVHGVQMSKLRYKTFEEIRTHVLEQGFDAPPGKGVYTNLPAYVLGLGIERIAGHSLAALAHEYFFEPFGMMRTTFFPTASDCAPTEIGERGEVRGLPHDESAYVFAKARRSAGHAGLFSTADDLLTFLEALLAGKLPAVLEGAQKGLGWQTEGEFLGSKPTGRFGKTGFTGCSVVCDPGTNTGLVILSNRTYPKRPVDTSDVNAIRCHIADIVL